MAGENRLRETEGFVHNGVGGMKVNVSLCSKLEKRQYWGG